MYFTWKTYIFHTDWYRKKSIKITYSLKSFHKSNTYKPSNTAILSFIKKYWELYPKLFVVTFESYRTSIKLKWVIHARIIFVNLSSFKVIQTVNPGYPILATRVRARLSQSNIDEKLNLAQFGNIPRGKSSKTSIKKNGYTNIKH